jgi:hypothetical protein
VTAARSAGAGPDRRAHLLTALRHGEGDPTLLGVSAHMLTVAGCPV